MAANEDNYWEVAYRVAYTASATKKVEWYGEFETYLKGTYGGGWVTSLIVESMFNVYFNAGTKTANKVETVTAVSDYSPITPTMATSGGRVLRTCA